MLRLRDRVDRYIEQEFQSSPGPRAGCYLPGMSLKLPSSLFQSSPGPRAGCYTRPGELSGRLDEVSILTRPEGRVLQPGWLLGHTASMFQSSPGPRAGCYCPAAHRAPNSDTGFNPHPARGPGATPQANPSPSISTCFNPHPARGPGATRAMVARPSARLRVSILTRPEGRVLPATSRWTRA